MPIVDIWMKLNPYYEHIKYNPYLFCIHAQPREPNDWYKESVKKGMFFDQAWPERIERFIDTSAVEVGMFIQNLSTYLLEEKIDISQVVNDDTFFLNRSIKPYLKYSISIWKMIFS
mgnify:CR=1 FL=1